MQRMEGPSNILSSFASKVDAAMGAWVAGIMLSIGGYVSESGVTTQSAGAIMMIRIDFALVPLVLLIVIAICCLAFSHLENKVAAFNAERAQATQSAEAE